ncbi:hypothetical protein VNO78_16096 [Psophocarpus tetragonolobus]|uniref:Uncharacterized protein n=1 Tax=Psophocarpus tetragonolobus TaxID=3891 RepID=A0AAN9XK64_PSOTE
MGLSEGVIIVASLGRGVITFGKLDSAKVGVGERGKWQGTNDRATSWVDIGADNNDDGRGPQQGFKSETLNTSWTRDSNGRWSWYTTRSTWKGLPKWQASFCDNRSGALGSFISTLSFTFQSKFKCVFVLYIMVYKLKPNISFDILFIS